MIVGVEISVIIAVYNGEKYIAETLESIIMQTHKNWECIIVDDGSTDNTIKIIDEFVRKDQRFALIKTIGGTGPYIAANAGMKEAKGKYIARTDADDISLPDRFAIQSAFLNEHVEINVCATGHYYLYDDGRLEINPYDTDLTLLKWQLIFRNRIVHSTMMARRSWFRNVGYYPAKRLTQDWHIWLEAISANTLHVIKTPLVKWRLHDNSLTKKENTLQLDEAARVSISHLQKRLLSGNINTNIVANIIAAIRGTRLSDMPDIKETLGFLQQVYTAFCAANKMPSEIKKKVRTDFHSIIDNLFALYAKHNLQNLVTYSKTFMIAGGSKRWYRGFIRQFLNI